MKDGSPDLQEGFPQWAYPVVNETRCTGCANCVDACPTQCLAMAGHLPWMPRPIDCISCGLCVAVCPSEALQLEGKNEIL